MHKMLGASNRKIKFAFLCDCKLVPQYPLLEAGKAFAETVQKGARFLHCCDCKAMLNECSFIVKIALLDLTTVFVVPIVGS